MHAEKMVSTKYIPKDHIVFEAQCKVKKLIEPLQKHFGIHYFDLGVTFPDGTGFNLTTHPEFYESWFQNELPLCQFSLPSNWYTWDACATPEMLQAARDHGIGKGILQLSHHGDKSLVVAFAGRAGKKEDYSLYFNHLPIFKRFKHYFLENATGLLLKAKCQRLEYLPKMQEKVEFLGGDMPAALCQQDLKQVNLYHPFNLLSKREFACFTLWVKGFSTHEISEHLEIAPTTINVYKARIRNKLGCEKRSQMVAKAQELGLIDYFII